VVSVARRTRIGDAWRWEQVLGDSEDPEKLNTSFIVTLDGRSGWQFTSSLLRCYYNFWRAHRALRFARDVRTPAVQAALTERRLTLREISSPTIVLLAWWKVKCRQSSKETRG
jgi:hypothetical protein